MNYSKIKGVTLVALLCSAMLTAQTNYPKKDWMLLDAKNDSVAGMSVRKGYTLLTKKKPTKVIVAVIDSGVDYLHEDLKSVMWVNAGEVAGNGKDDDGNGYVDDIHGWNFIGGKDGSNVNEDNLEMTRLVRRYKAKYEGKTEADFKTKEEKEELKVYNEAKKEYTAKKEGDQAKYDTYANLHTGLKNVNDAIKKEQNVEKVTLAELQKYNPEDKTAKQMKAFAENNLMKSGKFSSLDEAIEYVY